MHFAPSTPASWYNLDRRDGVAYAAQEAWVLNATIRDNILFGEPYDETRYRKGKLFMVEIGQYLTYFSTVPVRP